MTTSARLITADDLLNMPDDGKRYELIEGELIELPPPPGFLHGFVAGKAFGHLWSFVRSRRLGIVVAAETGFRIATDPDTVRAPDAAFVSADRLPRGGLPAGYLRMAPDLVVEVVSPSDRESEILNKVQSWLDAGSRLVWVMYPSTRSVRVYRPNGEVNELSSEQVLDAAPVLDGFSILVSELFDS